MNYYKHFENMLKRSIYHELLLKIFFYLPNFIVLALAFYATFLSSFYLASFSSGRNIAFINQILDLFGANNGIFPVYSVTVSAISSAILGLLSFFYIQQRLLQKQEHIHELKLELLKYQTNWGQYANVDNQEKTKILFERGVEITEHLRMEKFYD